MTDELNVLDRLAELESRLRYLEDEREIRLLIARNDYHFDCMQDEKWLNLWTEDGIFDLVSTVSYPDGSKRELSQRHEGKDALTAFVNHPEGHHRSGFYGHSMHSASVNLAIHVEGDTAFATSYSLLYQERDEAVHLLSGANNFWRLRREEDGWRLCERRRRQIGSSLFATNLNPT